MHADTHHLDMHGHTSYRVRCREIQLIVSGPTKAPSQYIPRRLHTVSVLSMFSQRHLPLAYMTEPPPPLANRQKPTIWLAAPWLRRQHSGCDQQVPLCTRHAQLQKTINRFLLDRPRSFRSGIAAAGRRLIASTPTSCCLLHWGKVEADTLA